MIGRRFMGRRYDVGLSPLGGRVPLPGTLAMALTGGGEQDQVIIPGMSCCVDLNTLRELIPRLFGGMTSSQFAALPSRRQDEMTRRLRRVIERGMREQQPGLLERFEMQRRWEESSAQRERIFREMLEPWSRGPLRLERPQASSLHHLLEYDVRSTPGGFAESIMHDTDTQSFVVENDWARAVPPEIAGEWRLPFEHCVWEMRISGVRVLTFTEAEDAEEPSMFSVYGVRGHWVMDDYRYHLGQDDMRAEACQSDGAKTEFRRANQMARDEIRASCVMLDSGLCEREEVRAPRPLVERARAERRAPPRDHLVVRLLRDRHRARAARSGGVSMLRAAGYQQRGHWRRGTWVHYADADSGREQYADDGGFWHSRTWRAWHFAGDPNNILEREYRL